MKIDKIKTGVSSAIAIIATTIFYPAVAMAALGSWEYNFPERGSALTINGVIRLVSDVVNALSQIAYIGIAAYIVWAGITMMRARDSTTEFAKGKTALWHAVIAALVIFGVTLILNTIARIAVDPINAVRG